MEFGVFKAGSRKFCKYAIVSNEVTVLLLLQLP